MGVLRKHAWPHSPRSLWISQTTPEPHLLVTGQQWLYWAWKEQGLPSSLTWVLPLPFTVAMLLSAATPPQEPSPSDLLSRGAQCAWVKWHRGRSRPENSGSPTGKVKARGRVEGRGVNHWLLWQPGLPRWREGKRGPYSRVAMATQILEPSYEDKNHTLHTFKEVPRTP